MSIEIQTEVWRYSRSKGSQRLLLIAIADNCNTESRTAWPTTAYLAGKTLLTQRSIHRLSSELEELGELEVHRVQDGMADDRIPGGENPVNPTLDS